MFDGIRIIKGMVTMIEVDRPLGLLSIALFRKLLVGQRTISIRNSPIGSWRFDEIQFEPETPVNSSVNRLYDHRLILRERDRLRSVRQIVFPLPFFFFFESLVQTECTRGENK